MGTIEQTINKIETDKRFAVCQQTINGLFEISIFYSPLNKSEINRQEIKQTINKNKSYSIAYHCCFEDFKRWLLANNIDFKF